MAGAKKASTPSPNPAIDKAIEALMGRIKPKEDGSFSIPEDTAVKIIQSAIAWEKVKHHIQDEPAGKYDPNNL